MICQSCRAALRAQRLVSPPRLSPTRLLALARTSALPPSTSQRLQHHQPSSRRLFFSSSASASSSSAALPSSAQEQDESHMSPAEASIAALLTSELQPTQLLVQDISGGCGSMYAIDITSPAFRGLTILKQQRLVNAALGDLVKQWHGVQIRTKVPPEDA